MIDPDQGANTETEKANSNSELNVGRFEWRLLIPSGMVLEFIL